jgi:hypothetical protein
VLNTGGAINFHWGATLIGDTRTTGANIYYHQDALGSLRSVTNGSQTKTDTLDYDAFGLPEVRTGTTSPHNAPYRAFRKAFREGFRQRRFGGLQGAGNAVSEAFRDRREPESTFIRYIPRGASARRGR